MHLKNIRVHMLLILLLTSFAPLISSSAETTGTEKYPQKTDKSLVPSQTVILEKLREEVGRLSAELQNYKTERYVIELKYMKTYYEYLSKKADLNLAQFEWQQTASERLLWLVVIVVLSGVVFSGYQLWKASKTSDFPGDSSIEIAVQKVKITSSVVGVIVLAVSIIFFYFFLIEVYRVKVVDLSATEVKPSFPASAVSIPSQEPNTSYMDSPRSQEN